jgi:hypothetical protein
MATTLTYKEAQERLGIQSYNTFNKLLNELGIKPISPGVKKLSIAAIEVIEHAGLDPERVRPIKLARLEQENDALRRENEELTNVINQMTAIGLIYRGNTLSQKLGGAAATG